MQSRRQFLGASTVVASLALAGCTESSGSVSSRRYAELTAGAAEQPLSIRGYRFQPLRDVAFEDFDTLDTVLGIDATNIEDIVAVDLSPETASEDRYWILQGSFEGETVASGFDGPLQRGHYGNFETFETESADSSALYGVNDGTVVVATDPNDYEQAIDGVRGEIPSLVEDYREFEKLARTLGDLDWVTVSIGETGENLPGNPVADGRGAEVRSGKSGYRVAAVYETEAVAREYETAFKREATRTRETIWDHKTAVDGRAIVLTASVPTAALGVSSTDQATGRQNILNRKEV
ncbi:hypothetical protein [Halobacteriaceae bacterium SHR40]|uniref:hypothetical protein n=1 Tax=Halovenus amylolytica TaxID=2500550 RepID=UPI000FE3C26F